MVRSSFPVFCRRVNHRKIRPKTARRRHAGTGMKKGEMIFLNKNITKAPEHLSISLLRSVSPFFAEMIYPKQPKAEMGKGIVGEVRDAPLCMASS